MKKTKQNQMNKFVVVGDVHISARNDSPIVAEHQIKFFEEQLFPYMKSNGITHILQTGDLLDRRKYSNHSIIQLWKERVFDKMIEYGFEMTMILGNHDIALKSSLKINGPELMFNSYKNVKVIKEPTEIVVEGTQILMLPWICSENYTQTYEAIEKSNSSYCLGHFEFAGFELQKGHMMHEGSSIDPFKKFSLVISGHYHTKSYNENIVYTGTPYELTWIDADDPKGFWVFDPVKQDLDFVRNTTTLFNKIVYDDLDKGLDYYKTIKFLQLKDTYVKIYVVNKTDPHGFSKLIDRLNTVGVADLSIIEQVVSDDVELDDSIKIEDTMELVEDFVDKTETSLDKDKIVSLIKELHLLALTTLE